MSEKRSGVAFFDSGIGGLTVLAECVKRGLKGPFYYYGDNLHAPYGNLPREKIRELVFSAFERLAALGVRAAVAACNTATALCVDSLREKYDFPIVGAEPAVFSAARRGGEALVLTTRATYESGRFRALCERAEDTYTGVRLRLCPCDGLAGEIERRLFECDYDFSAFLPGGSPTSVVLGCTHYVYLKKYIEDFYGCRAYDGNEGMARRLESVLGARTARDRDGRPLATPLSEKSEIVFLGASKEYNQRVFEQMFAKRGFFDEKSG